MMKARASAVEGSTPGPMRTLHIPKFKKLIEVMEIRGVKLFVHWSVLLIGAVILLGAVEEPLLAFKVLAAYYGVILLHECGHMVIAQRPSANK